MKFDKFVHAVFIALVVAIVSPIFIVMLPFEFITKWSVMEYATVIGAIALVVFILLASFAPNFLKAAVRNNDESLEDYARYRGDIT